tara:strand:- start:466 stop:1041 length:576 start_codon:yes stop_codon:yes gene_type:complete
MTVGVAEPTEHSFTSTGAASYTLVPLRIRSADSIDLYADGVAVAGGAFSVSAIATTSPYTFTLSLSPAIPVSEDILVVQKYDVDRQADYVPGQTLTATALNDALDDLTIMVRDVDASKAFRVTETTTAATTDVFTGLTGVELHQKVNASLEFAAGAGLEVIGASVTAIGEISVRYNTTMTAGLNVNMFVHN